VRLVTHFLGDWDFIPKMRGKVKVEIYSAHVAGWLWAGQDAGWIWLVLLHRLVSALHGTRHIPNIAFEMKI